MNNFMAFGLMLIVVCLNTVAQVLLKLGADKSLLNSYLFSGILAYGASTIFYIFVLGKLNLSLAYPAIIGLTIIATTLCGAMLLHEKVSPLTYMGIGLMLVSVCTISFGRILSS